MRIAVIGTGYVGIVTGTCFAEIGHDVICVDLDAEKIKSLQKGSIPIYERGLQEMLVRNSSEGRLTFTTDPRKALVSAELVFSCVGTPPDKDHRADLQYVEEVARTFGKYINSYTVLVMKSTVPVGTSETCHKLVAEELKKRKKKISFDIASNPEFLREGTAMKDAMNPDRIVVGIANARCKKIMRSLYYPLTRVGSTLMFTSVRNAEVIKYAANAFLATKISFMNEMANFCERAGCDVQEVAKGIGLDKRIGSRYLHAGIGYGGSCFPKDLRALIQKGKDLDFEFSILKATEAVNERQKNIAVEKLKKYIPHLEGKVVAVWGLSFKPHTDDIRDASSLYVIHTLRGEGAVVHAFDPKAMPNAKKRFKNSVKYFKNNYDALKGANALLILTEWPEFVGADLKKMRTLMKNRIVIDGRNIFDPATARKAGFIYEGIGKPLSRARR